MPCNPEDEFPPPTKKLRPESPVEKFSFSVEEVGRICSASSEKCELEVLTRELDSLDEDAVFSRMQRYLATGSVQLLTSSLPPLSGLYPFPKRNCSAEHCIYLPPKKTELDESPCVSEDTPIVPQVAGDSSRREIAQGARLEASVLQKIAYLKHQGLWSSSRLPKVMEPNQGRSHHEYLMDEVLWLSADFVEERKWKKEIAHHVSMSTVLRFGVCNLVSIIN
ncbi:unnamed protein product [Echinostoma caproni]|uniref:HSA domain-containing protein n=1 Tax=Echinostoma caproni TaxID=27848 RepID=A0A183B5Y4_9TREM|nr:unnamed protein product [Echinostoma caproni]